MSDYISRQAAIEALKEVSEHYTDKGREWHPHINFMVQAIEELPSAEKRGAWKHRKTWSVYVCDQCSFENREVSRYCPNCGARMKGESDE